MFVMRFCIFSAYVLLLPFQANYASKNDSIAAISFIKNLESTFMSSVILFSCNFITESQDIIGQKLKFDKYSLIIDS